MTTSQVIWKKLNRRRSSTEITSTSETETSPLSPISARTTPPEYSTFPSTHTSKPCGKSFESHLPPSRFKPPPTWKESLIEWLLPFHGHLLGLRRRVTFGTPARGTSLLISQLKVVICGALIVYFTMSSGYFNLDSHQHNSSLALLNAQIAQPNSLTWEWHYNAFNPVKEATELQGGAETTIDMGMLQSSSDRRNLLLVQITGTPALEAITNITSLPNRAYARHWKRDYVRFASPARPDTHKSCYLEPLVLASILADQRQSSSPSWIGDDSIHHLPYDLVALLASDTIIMDMDYDLNRLLPPGMLLAVGGIDTALGTLHTRTGVVLFNLKHPSTERVSRLWLERTESTCVGLDEMQLLWTIITSVTEESSHILNMGLVSTLTESMDGFLGLHNDDRVLKGIATDFPGPRDTRLLTNVDTYRKVLQMTADSVCYRYYPRCEVML